MLLKSEVSDGEESQLRHMMAQLRVDASTLVDDVNSLRDERCGVRVCCGHARRSGASAWQACRSCLFRIIMKALDFVTSSHVVARGRERDAMCEPSEP